jgi:hypothetical protein
MLPCFRLSSNPTMGPLKTFRFDPWKVRTTDEGYEVLQDIGKLLLVMLRKGYLDLRTKKLPGVQPAESWRNGYGETQLREAMAISFVVFYLPNCLLKLYTVLLPAQCSFAITSLHHAFGACCPNL